ncbi:MAG: hypothetical protein Q7R56_01500 [Nanoarchaeota archaeon]|nr:hypothetical protein [Nanoarchaeota archaeon]
MLTDITDEWKKSLQESEQHRQELQKRGKQYLDEINSIKQYDADTLQDLLDNYEQLTQATTESPLSQLPHNNSITPEALQHLILVANHRTEDLTLYFNKQFIHITGITVPDIKLIEQPSFTTLDCLLEDTYHNQLAASLTYRLGKETNKERKAYAEQLFLETGEQYYMILLLAPTIAHRDTTRQIHIRRPQRAHILYLSTYENETAEVLQGIPTYVHA